MPKTKKPTEKKITVLLPVDDFDKLSQVAADELRSVSKQASLFIKQGLERKEVPA